jgi:HemY protein
VLRTARFLLVVGLLAAAAVWLADRPGRVAVEWQGWRVDTSFAVLAAAAAALMVAAALLYRLWGALRAAPGRFAALRHESRRRRGYQALTRGMVAVAAGDPDEARRQARKAETLLDEPPLTLLLAAQTAQLEGDETAAARFFAAMAEAPDTEFLGLRGLITQAVKAGERERALELARRAYRLKPRAGWVNETLFDLQVQSGQWLDAALTLKEAAKRRLAAPETARRHAALLDVAQAREAEARGDDDAALKLLRRALDGAPDLVPAAARLARLLLRRGKERKAAETIAAAWARTPHPDLLAAFLEAKADQAPLKRVTAVQRLVRDNPDHPESRLALAEAALGAELWGEARRHLAPLVGDGAQATARACRLMAELEEAEHGDHARARAWLMRASQAEPDPAWVCRRCGHAVADWAPRCDRCGTFDGFAWRAPERGAVLAAPAGAEAALVLPPAAAADGGA